MGTKREILLTNLAICTIIIIIGLFGIDLATGHSEPVEGVIFAKTFIPERYWYTYEAQHDDKGKYVGTIPVQHYDPPKYTLSLEFDGGIETIYTNQTIYSYKKIGDLAKGYKYSGGFSKLVYNTWINQ